MFLIYNYLLLIGLMYTNISKIGNLEALLEFPVLFLGTPKDQIILYSLMAYSGIKCGTFY